MPDVTGQEIADAFYRSYGEGSDAGLDPRLTDPSTGGRRKLTAADAQFADCWMETRRLLRAARGYVPIPLGFPVDGPVVSCPLAAVNTDRPKYEPQLWNDHDPARAAPLDRVASEAAVAAHIAGVTARTAPDDAAAKAAAIAATETAGVAAAAARSEGAIQLSTNCYAYAMNSRVGHPKGDTPQPGEKSGAPESTAACPAVSAAVVQDGAPDDIRQAERCPYNKQQQKPPPDRPGYYLVALVSTSKPSGYDAADGVEYGNDYHWYRQDDNGRWSHKPGTTKAIDTDSAGQPISNPETANRRTLYRDLGMGGVDLVIDYDNFCGYFYVKKGGAPVGP